MDVGRLYLDPAIPLSSPSARRVPSIAYDASIGQVVVFGGIDEATGQRFNDTWGWNGSDWTQLLTYSRPGQRYATSMDFDPMSDGLLLFAGWTQCCTPDDDTWLLVPVSKP
jgi:hypothetical protein